MTWRARLVVPILVLAGACGGSDGDDQTRTGRVTTKTEARTCIRPDREAAEICMATSAVAIPVEVGQCVTLTLAPTPDASRLESADEAACAAGDLGDGDD